MPDVYVGVGSNIDPERNIATAVKVLRETYGTLELSSAYRNPPVGFDGDDFVNLVLCFRSASGPAVVEESLSDLEKRAGRTRTGAGSGPRTLDLDLLLYGSLVDAELRLPRDDILMYPFVLCPLAELVPDLAHPMTGISVADSWKEMVHSSPPFTNIGPPADIEAGSGRTFVAAADR
jgi:2-amino-4-hydroxy-6-hydroxymethyldihydropteridine diphosphokinase